MSAPFIDLGHWIPVAVLGASLAGSAHCVAMCGGLVAANARTKRDWGFYQVGRLIGYISLGILAGSLGKQVFSTAPEMILVTWFSTTLYVIAFLIAGIKIWQKKTPHFALVPQSTLQKLYQKAFQRPTFAGLLTALLPCGWLHLFVLGAVSTQSPILGAVYLTFFWLGSLPALAAAPWITQRMLAPLTQKSPRLAGSVLIGIALLTLGNKIIVAFPGPFGLNPRTQSSGSPTDYQCHP